MSGLGPQARQLLELGKNAGEPDDASVARARAVLVRRVGVSVLAVSATTTATTAAASTTSATSAAVVAVKAAPFPGVVAVAPAATVATKLVAAPLAAKVLAAVVLSVGAALGTMAYRAEPRPASPPEAHLIVPPPAVVSPVPGRRAADDVARLAAPPRQPSIDPTPALEAPVQVTAERPRPSPDTPVVQAPSPSSVAAASLANDVENLRRAQASLVAGQPEEALAAALRVSANGPLADEREGVRVLATCALGAPGASEQARDFVERRPMAPLAMRVRAACLGQK